MIDMEREVVVDAELQERIDKAKALLKRFGYYFENTSVTPAKLKEGLIALYIRDEDAIFISDKHIKKAEDQELLSTLIEEYFHSVGYSDEDRSYEQRLTREIAQLILEVERKDMFIEKIRKAVWQDA